MGNKHKNVLNILSCEINASWNNKIFLSLLKSLLEKTGIRKVGKIWNKFIAGWVYNTKSILQSFAIPIKLSTMYPAILFPVFINDKEICFKRAHESLCHTASTEKHTTDISQKSTLKTKSYPAMKRSELTIYASPKHKNQPLLYGSDKI